jgi:hypothetical protein
LYYSPYPGVIYRVVVRAAVIAATFVVPTGTETTTEAPGKTGISVVATAV